MADYFEKARENVRKSGATRTFDLYADPGHSWLKVPKSAIRGVGIADKITPYSYQRGEFAYLEEDVDAPLFIRETERQYGVRVMLRQHVTDNESRIRNYDQYNPAENGPASVLDANRFIRQMEAEDRAFNTSPRRRSVRVRGHTKRSR